MPNHVTNIVRFIGDTSLVNKILEYIQLDSPCYNGENGDGTIDFNKIIPMPEALKVEEEGREHNGLRAYREFIKEYTVDGTFRMHTLSDIPVEAEDEFFNQRHDVSREEWELGKAAWHSLPKFGGDTWYEWCVANWGTKWNAYQFLMVEPSNELCFHTAWSAPHPVIERLAEMYPDTTIVHRWADEDFGMNCGERVYEDGKVISEYMPDYGPRSLEFAAEVMGGTLWEHGYVEDAAGTGYTPYEAEMFQVVRLFDGDALFAKGHLGLSKIPKGLVRYDLFRKLGSLLIRTEKSLCECGEEYVGTIITNKPIFFNNNGSISPDKTELVFTGEEMDFGEYLGQSA